MSATERGDGIIVCAIVDQDGAIKVECLQRMYARWKRKMVERLVVECEESNHNKFRRASLHRKILAAEPRTMQQLRF